MYICGGCDQFFPTDAPVLFASPLTAQNGTHWRMNTNIAFTPSRVRGMFDADVTHPVGTDLCGSCQVSLVIQATAVWAKEQGRTT